MEGAGGGMRAVKVMGGWISTAFPFGVKQSSWTNDTLIHVRVGEKQ